MSVLKLFAIPAILIYAYRGILLQKRLRYSVALLLNKEHKDADKRYRVPFVPDQHMLRASEWPAPANGGIVQRTVYDQEADKLVQKTFYRPDLRNLNRDPK